MIIALMLTVNFKTTEVTVTEVTNNEIVVVEDNNGQEWEFYGEDFYEGEKVKVHFKNDHIIGVEEK